MATAIQNQRAANEENKRANQASEGLQAARIKNDEAALKEQRRHNRAAERETERRNTMEDKRYKSQLELQKTQAKAQALSSAVGGLATGAVLLFNDWGWYAKSADFAKTIMNLPSHEAIGTVYPLNATPRTKARFSAPALLTLYSHPAIGTSNSTASSVNICAEQMWSRVNENNGRNSSYASADMMMYQLGVAGLLQFLGILERGVSWLNTYIGDNNAMPRAIINAMGWDYADCKKHRYELVSIINDLRAFLRAYRFVPDFYLADRWYFTARSVLFDDSDAERVQFYMHMPTFIYRLSVIGTETKLIPEALLSNNSASSYSGSLTYDDLYDFAEKLKSEFISAQDVKIMNADIKAHYGEQATVIFKENDVFPLESVPMLSNDKNALFQIRNAVVDTRFAGDIVNSDGIHYSDYIIREERPGNDAAYIYCTGGLSDDLPQVQGRISDQDGYLVESDVAHPDAATLIEMTRCIPVRLFGSSSFFTEVPAAIGLSFMDLETQSGGSAKLAHKSFQVQATGVEIDEEEPADYEDTFERMYLSTMKYAPMLALTTSLTTYVPAVLTTNWEKVTWVPAATLDAANASIAKRMLSGNQ